MAREEIFKELIKVTLPHNDDDNATIRQSAQVLLCSRVFNLF
jgi:hypothetical protein